VSLAQEDQLSGNSTKQLLAVHPFPLSEQWCARSFFRFSERNSNINPLYKKLTDPIGANVLVPRSSTPLSAESESRSFRSKISAPPCRTASSLTSKIFTLAKPCPRQDGVWNRLFDSEYHSETTGSQDSELDPSDTKVISVNEIFRPSREKDKLSSRDQRAFSASSNFLVCFRHFFDISP